MRADFRRHAISKYLSKCIFIPASLRDLKFCVFWVAFISLSSTALADTVSEQPVKKDPITQDSLDRGGCETQKIRCDDQNKERSQTADKPSFASLTIELAATYKTLGDQHYLEDKNRTNASDAYCKADQYTHEIDKASAESTLGDADRALLQLLRADIAYRKQLLRSGASFWGLEGAVPGNPLKQLAAFRLGFETYDKSVQQITDSLRASRSIHVEQAQIASHEIEQRLSKFVQEQKESIGNIQVSRYGDTLSNARARQGYVRQEIDRIEKQADSLATQASNLNAQIGKTIVDALASSAGVPPGMVSALQKGDMTQVVKGAALKALNDPELLKNPAVASALSDLSTRAPDLSNMMRQVSDARDAVEKLKSQAAAIRYGIDTVGQFQRDPSFENLLTLGNAAWNKLPASEQQALRQGVERFKPVGTLVQLASQANAVDGRLDEAVQAARNSVAQALAEVDNNGKLLAAQVIAFSDAMAKQGDWQQVTQFYKQMFNQTIARTPLKAENSRRLLLELVAIAPEAFASWLEQSKPAAFATLLKTNRLNNRADLVARLRKDGFASISGLQVRTVSAKGTGLEAVYIISDGRAQPVGDVPNAFASIISQFPAAGDVAQLTKSLETIYTVVASQGIVARKHLTLALLETAPTVVQRLVNEATLLAENSEKSAKKTADQFRDALWAKAYSSLPGKVKEQTIEAAAKVVAGNGLANAAIDNQDSATTVLAHVISNTPAPAPALAPNTDHQAASANDAALRAMATMALDAACPGAGVAVGVISNMIALNGMWDKLNELFDDEKRLLAEERQLITTIQTAEIDKVIAEKERAVASASVEAAQAQIALWQQASDQAAADGDIERAIIRARRPLIFFTGEELRRHFDLFNRAMTMWTGIGQKGRPFLESYIKDNPQYVRFAVDHDIQLYGWLNRERDGARIDLDLVARRWQQKLALLEAVCSDSTMGCVPGLGRSHELSQNKAYLSGLMTSTQRRAFAGLLSRRNGAGEYQLVFTPTEAPLLAQDRNVRLLDIRMNWVDAQGVALPEVVHGVTLNHPGFAALVGAGPDGVSLRQEILAPQQQSAFEPGPFSNLQASFDGFKGLSDSQLAMASTPRFYGYSPITTWNLRVDGAAIPRGAADLSIHVAYVFSRDNALASESNFVELLKQRVPQSAVSGLADHQKKIWMEFPVSWYRFTSVKQTARDPSTEKWVTPISGPLTTRDIFLKPGMSPIQFRPNSENLSTDGYCLGESAITHARPAIAGAEPAEKVNAIAAICLPREVIAQELGNYLRTRARDPQSQKPLSPEQARAELGTLMQSMDASGFCDCPAPRPQGALCKVQSSL